MTHGCAVHTAREPVCDGAVDVLKQAGALATTRLDHIHRHCMQLFKLPDKRTFQFRAALFLASVWVSIAVTHVMPGGRAIVRALALANTAYIMWMMCAYLWRRRERQQACQTPYRRKPVADDHRQALAEPVWFTLVIPAKDECYVVERCVQALLAQVYPPHMFHIVLVDDNSTDGTARVVERLQVQHDARMVQLWHGGAGAAAGGKAASEPVRMHDGSAAWWTRERAPAASSPDESRVCLTVLQRHGGGGGKAGAMNAAWPVVLEWYEQQQERSHAAGAVSRHQHVVGYVDADAVAPRDLLQCVAQALRGDARVAAVQALRTVHPRHVTSLLAGLQFGEFWLDCVLQEMRRSAWGVAEMRGNGEFIRHSALHALGPWNEQSLTDDLDMSTRVHVVGADVEMLYCMEPGVQDEPVDSLVVLASQRFRWQNGGLGRFLDYLPLLLSPWTDVWAEIVAAEGHRVPTAPLLRRVLKRLDLVVFFLVQYVSSTAVVPDLVISWLFGLAPALRPFFFVSWLLVFIFMATAWPRMRAAGLRAPVLALYAAFTTLFLSVLISATAMAAHFLPLFPRQLQYEKVQHGAPQPTAAPASSKRVAGPGEPFPPTSLWVVAASAVRRHVGSVKSVVLLTIVVGAIAMLMGAGGGALW